MKPRILIVEDDSNFKDLIYFQLEKNGFPIELLMDTQSVAEFSEIHAVFDPEVILLDLNILDSQGLSTLKTASKNFPDSTIIVLSGTDSDKIAIDSLKGGAQDFVLKTDISSKILIKTIEFSRERKHLQDELEKANNNYRQGFANSPLPMFVLDGPHLIVIRCNLAAEKLYGFDYDSCINRGFQHLNKNNEQIVIDTELANFEKTLVQKTKSGKLINIVLYGNKISPDSEMYVCLVVDKTEEILFELKKNKIISEAQEKEKKKISRELHDGISQNMVILNLWFSMFQFSPEDKALKKQFSEMINLLINELRSITYSLQPPSIEKGLLSAIKNMHTRANLIEGVNVVLEMQNIMSETDFENTDIANIYRIVQEFVANSIKHAQANEIKISISKNEKGVHIIATDNGIGFDEEHVVKGLGIQNIETRIALSKLTGSVTSKIGKGTRLNLLIE
jgi:signal transduction histidine kinase/FixJ family two-component response regulator